MNFLTDLNGGTSTSIAGFASKALKYAPIILASAISSGSRAEDIERFERSPLGFKDANGVEYTIVQPQFLLDYAKRKKKELKKGAYESSIDFETRAGQPDSMRPLHPGTKYAVKLNIFFDTKNGEGLARYDADMGAYRFEAFEVLSNYVHSSDENGYPTDEESNASSVAVLQTRGTRQSFVGQNAFGVKVAASAVRNEEISLRIDGNPYNAYVGALRITAPATPDRARAYGPGSNFEVFALGEFLNARITYANQLIERATIHSPTQKRRDQYTIPFRIEQIIVRHRSTGDVIGKL